MFASLARRFYNVAAEVAALLGGDAASLPGERVAAEANFESYVCHKGSCGSGWGSPNTGQIGALAGSGGRAGPLGPALFCGISNGIGGAALGAWYAVPVEDLLQVATVDVGQRVQPVNAGNGVFQFDIVQAAAGKDEFSVAKLAGQLQTRAMNITE